MLRVGRGRQPCGTNLKTAVRYPYPPISIWLIDRITVNPKVAETINAAAAVTSSQLVTITIHLYQFWRAKTDGLLKSITGICSGERHDQ